MITFLKNMLSRQPAAFERQIFIVGYPKTGNTWLRMMLGKYVQLILNRDSRLPMPLFEAFEEVDPSIPLLQVTHGPLEWVKQVPSDLTIENVVAPYIRQRTILLVRNIPDVLVSLFWQSKTRDVPPYAGDISAFIRDRIYGVEKAVTFYRLWFEARNMCPSLLLVRYEDMRSAPVEQLRKLVEFLEIPVDESHLLQAVNFSDFDNMRKLEVGNLDKPLIKYATSGHSIFATGNVQETNEAFHVRKGEVNGYFDYLNEVDVKYLQTQIKDTFSKWYGYRDATSPETFA